MVNLLRLALAVLLSAVALAAAIWLADTLTTSHDKPTLTVYTYDSFAAEWGPGPAIKDGFEAQCACLVDFVTAEDAIATLRRVQLEGATSRADIVLGLDTAIAGEARATGLFADHGVDTGGLSLPGGWDDRQFVPFDTGYFAFVYDTRLVSAPPASFEGLIALPDDFKVVIQDPRSSTPGLGLVTWIAEAYGDRAPEIWAGLKPHVLTMTRGWSEAYALFLAGEADMVLSYTTSPAYHAISDDDPGYAAAAFSEGHLAQVEVAGILETSPNRALAAQFLAYLVSPPAQEVIPTANWMYPVIDLGDALPPAFGPPPATVLTVDEAEMAANAARWIAEALAALS
jgi:thiamine transport system substrate-binding protein